MGQGYQSTSSFYTVEMVYVVARLMHSVELRDTSRSEIQLFNLFNIHAWTFLKLFAMSEPSHAGIKALLKL